MANKADVSGWKMARTRLKQGGEDLPVPALDAFRAQHFWEAPEERSVSPEEPQAGLEDAALGFMSDAGFLAQHWELGATTHARKPWRLSPLYLSMGGQSWRSERRGGIADETGALLPFVHHPVTSNGFSLPQPAQIPPHKSHPCPAATHGTAAKNLGLFPEPMRGSGAWGGGARPDGDPQLGDGRTKLLLSGFGGFVTVQGATKDQVLSWHQAAGTPCTQDLRRALLGGQRLCCGEFPTGRARSDESKSHFSWAGLFFSSPKLRVRHCPNKIGGWDLGKSHETRKARRCGASQRDALLLFPNCLFFLSHVSISPSLRPHFCSRTAARLAAHRRSVFP